MISKVPNWPKKNPKLKMTQNPVKLRNNSPLTRNGKKRKSEICKPKEIDRYVYLVLVLVVERQSNPIQSNPKSVIDKHQMDQKKQTHERSANLTFNSTIRQRRHGHQDPQFKKTLTNKPPPPLFFFSPPPSTSTSIPISI